MGARRAKRYVLGLAVIFIAIGCAPRVNYQTEFAEFRDVPNSTDFREIQSRARSPDEPHDDYRGLCPDDGYISGWTNDRAATERAIDARNDRYHRGQRRAGLATRMLRS